MITLSMPYPPSTNRLWRSARTNGKTKVLNSDEAKRFYSHAAVAIAEQGARGRKLAGPIEMTVTLYPRNRAKFDIDNRLKSLLDAFTKSAVWIDDSQVQRITVERAEEIVKEGRCIVTISTMEKSS